MRRIDRQQLRASFYIKIKTMRQGKNGRSRHPMPELSDDYAAGMSRSCSWRSWTGAAAW
jgi:hypothetical protein